MGTGNLTCVLLVLPAGGDVARYEASWFVDKGMGFSFHSNRLQTVLYFIKRYLATRFLLRET
jgi:hypothetical protein